MNILNQWQFFLFLIILIIFFFYNFIAITSFNSNSSCITSTKHQNSAQTWTLLQHFNFRLLKNLLNIILINLIKSKPFFRYQPRIDISLQLKIRSIRIQMKIKAIKYSSIMHVLIKVNSTITIITNILNNLLFMSIIMWLIHHWVVFNIIYFAINA